MKLTYYQQNKERLKEKQREYYYNNKIKCIKNSLAYAKKNKEKIQEYQKKYRPIANKARRKQRGSIRIFGKPIPKKVLNQRYKALKKLGGPLTVKTIQLVYEDNIKTFGTLTCIYCFKPTLFGKDTLEHIVPLSKGGTNMYKNLGIACLSCNCSKNNKLLNEWKEIN